MLFCLRFCFILSICWALHIFKVPKLNGQMMKMIFNHKYNHAKIAFKINYDNMENDNTAWFCVGDANHSPVVSQKAGMTVSTLDNFNLIVRLSLAVDVFSRATPCKTTSNLIISSVLPCRSHKFGSSQWIIAVIRLLWS